MPEHSPRRPPLRPPHRPMTRRLNELFVLDPSDTEAEPVVPLHSDIYGKLAVGTAADTTPEYYQCLEDQAYI